MTKVLTNTGWVYVVIVLDWYTKKIVGHYSGKQARTAEWLQALEKGLNREFPGGVRGNGLKLMSDNGQVFKSYNTGASAARLQTRPTASAMLGRLFFPAILLTFNFYRTYAF